MTGSDKRRALILLVLVAIMVAIIAANLRQLEFQPGMPIPELAGNPGGVAPLDAEQVVAVHANQFIKMLLALTLSCATLYVIVRALWSCKWRDIWSYLRQAIVVCIVATGLPFLIMMLGKSKGTHGPELYLPPPSPIRTAPLGTVPSALLWVVGLGLLVASLFLAWLISRPERRDSTMDRIGRQAQQAWQALRNGERLKDAIIRCYRQMSLALAEEQGLERDDFMTTSEFETLLTAAGVPCEPVHRLTRLFELVRYGKGQPDPADEQSAILCLEAIMSFCQARRKADGHE